MVENGGWGLGFKERNNQKEEKYEISHTLEMEQKREATLKRPQQREACIGWEVLKEHRNKWGCTHPPVPVPGSAPDFLVALVILFGPGSS